MELYQTMTAFREDVRQYRVRLAQVHESCLSSGLENQKGMYLEIVFSLRSLTRTGVAFVPAVLIEDHVAVTPMEATKTEFIRVGNAIQQESVLNQPLSSKILGHGIHFKY
ncbi:hypothetical protein OCU04_005712 [Sclerotinia nivalis]|uniref:Uncharacterized protein n=1 Tax=Sclerotinia nivalis TaxID=352851 RepID=A0A9X0AQM9_9HELO|nr:hypothetical protein OCU04_005712 [Sclerotinia nivalis]